MRSRLAASGFMSFFAFLAELSLNTVQGRIERMNCSASRLASSFLTPVCISGVISYLSLITFGEKAAFDYLCLN